MIAYWSWQLQNAERCYFVIEWEALTMVAAIHEFSSGLLFEQAHSAQQCYSCLHHQGQQSSLGVFPTVGPEQLLTVLLLPTFWWQLSVQTASRNANSIVISNNRTSRDSAISVFHYWHHYYTTNICWRLAIRLTLQSGIQAHIYSLEIMIHSFFIRIHQLQISIVCNYSRST